MESPGQLPPPERVQVPYELSWSTAKASLHSCDLTGSPAEASLLRRRET